MESKRVKVKVVMLPTKGDSTFGYITETKTYHRYTNEENSYNNLANNLAIPQHLYFISDEEIKMGDYYFRLGAKEIYRGSGYTNDCRKVIASTEKLVDVPLIPQEFIENYCEVGGIDEVEIEYGLNYDEHYELIGNPIESWNENKADSNNYVSVHSIKDSWSRQEVEELIESAVHNFSSMNSYDYDNLNRWIKDNL